MKHSVILKVIAIVLAACALTVTLVSGVGIVVLASEGLYSTSYEDWAEQFYVNRTGTLARMVAESYSARQLGNLSAQELNIVGWGNTQERLSDMWGMESESWAYSIANTSGTLLEKAHPIDISKLSGYSHVLRVDYPIKVQESADWSEHHSYWIDNEEQELYLQFRESPEYEVTIWITPGGLEEFSGISLGPFQVLCHLRYYLIAFAAVGLLLTAGCLVYLCCAAGKSRKSGEVRPGGLNRLPLDVYTAALGGICLLMFWLFVVSVEEALYYGSDAFLGWFILAGGAALVAALCVVAFIFALAAQWKMGNCYIWHHSLIGWCWGKVWKFCKLCWKGLCKLYGLLPLIWKYLLIAFGMAAVPLFCLVMLIAVGYWGRMFWMLMLMIAVAADIAMVCYGAYAYGTVLKGARKMAEGDLHGGIDTKYLRGSYKACAEDLNALADVAMVAAKNQMKADRMKTELITNVSHDIKTPLTSVINYIDLLQKAETQEQSAQYLEVLDRQSQKLKKLIDDLMEMSKATTGNIAVDLARLDAVEAVTQALGEFTDKLDAQSLSVVLRTPEQPAFVQADGRLTWRVLSNLMGNIVKYALPGTRVYVDVAQLDGQVVVSLKNISREELNISAEELTERFVRGDASRNTEGSGLGLNIAKSFMALQGGQLNLLVDGDLFKVTLIFRAE